MKRFWIYINISFIITASFAYNLRTAQTLLGLCSNLALASAKLYQHFVRTSLRRWRLHTTHAQRGLHRCFATTSSAIGRLHPPSADFIGKPCLHSLSFIYTSAQRLGRLCNLRFPYPCRRQTKLRDGKFSLREHYASRLECGA